MSGAHCIVLEASGRALVFKAEPGFSRSASELPRPIDHHITHPRTLLRKPLARGDTWTEPGFAYGSARMTATSAVEAIDASVEVAAGSFERCALVRTDFEQEGHDDESHRRLNRRASGTRRVW